MKLISAPFLAFFFVFSTSLVFAQDQTITGNLTVGSNTGPQTGEGNRIYFSGVQSNSDEIWMSRYNTIFNSSDLRINIGDDYGYPGDRFLVGTTNWSHGQFYAHLAVQGNGNVGIGTDSPLKKFEVSNSFGGTGGVIGKFHSPFSETAGIEVGSSAYGYNGGFVRFTGAGGGAVGEVKSWFSDSFRGVMSFSHHITDTDYQEVLRIEGGNVGVGTTKPGEKLSVNGKIRAHEIKVETANWPDYVFDLSYTPTSLPDLEEFIKTHKHLPEIPSAKEVEEKGVSLGEMNAKLLKKIEELTLYLIDQNRKSDKQNQAIEELRREIAILKSEG